MAVVLTKRQVPAEYGTRAIVMGRGWTQAAIARFLAEPDGTMPNTRYRGSPPMRLYAMARVQAIEGTREWQEWYLASQRRRAAALERVGAGGVAERGDPPERAAAVAGAAESARRAPGGGGEGVGAARDAGVRRGRGSNREVA
ncbi:hypothetical protein [Embleya sp. NBC_00896]|uniref:hypothetical protein n=1 Tax=Embleya sp. NBC_00896 TaxID=2975961 RepID=UPI00386E558A|nr:hypothetical protein OG928_05525 [Embleya sp. NBC_00896]